MWYNQLTQLSMQISSRFVKAHTLNLKTTNMLQLVQKAHGEVKITFRKLSESCLLTAFAGRHRWTRCHTGWTASTKKQSRWSWECSTTVSRLKSSWNKVGLPVLFLEQLRELKKTTNSYTKGSCKFKTGKRPSGRYLTTCAWSCDICRYSKHDLLELQMQDKRQDHVAEQINKKERERPDPLWKFTPHETPD